MILSTITYPALPAPHPVPNLRPAADAAATARISRPAVTFALSELGHSQPSSLSQTSLIGRLLIAAVDRSSSTILPSCAVEQPERVLKPFGVAMLPSCERDTPDRLLDPDPLDDGSDDREEPSTMA